jgi:FKBP-type peptidyl-prolyl cis-trans isomerase
MRFALICMAALMTFSAAGCGSDKKTDYVDKKTGIGPGPVDADAPEEFTVTDSGLKYRILRKSDGAKPGPSDGVAMHYRGWLDSGHEFENSYAAGNAVPQRMNDLIPGWKEGLLLISKGGMIELEIPPGLAFGHRGRQEVGIPPDATLHVLVELLDVARYRTEPLKSDPDASKEFTNSESGLQYRIRRKGNGKKAKPTDFIVVRVKASLEDGTEVQNSYVDGFPNRIAANAGIPGFIEAMQIVDEGGMIEFIVPPELGWGDQQVRKIPPGSTLRFLVELDEVHD